MHSQPFRQDPARGLSRAELDAESAVGLPDKEVLSLLNLNVDLDLMLDLAAPIDLAVAANANVAAPIAAAVSADVLTVDSMSQALGQQDVTLEQGISGTASAEAPQSAVVDQTGSDGGSSSSGGFAQAQPTGDTVTDTTDTVGDTTGDIADTTGDLGDTVGDVTDPVTDAVGDVTDGATDAVGDVTDGATDAVGDVTEDVTGAVGDAVTGATEALDASTLLQDGLLNVDVNANLDAALAAPVAGAVAANANIAAPIAAAVSANVATVGSESTAVVDQVAVITQDLDDVTAEAVADQDAEVIQ